MLPTKEKSENPTLDDILSYPVLRPQHQGEIVNLRENLQSELAPKPSRTVTVIQPNLPEDKYSLLSIVLDLLPRLEAARKHHLVSGVRTDTKEVIIKYIDALQSQFFQEHEIRGAEKYWQEVSRLMTGDFMEAYSQVGKRKNKVESSPGYRHGYGNQYTLSALCSLPGLVTLRMPYSTPIIMGGLAAVGYKVVHPAIQKTVNEDVRCLAEFTVHQQNRINHTTLSSRQEEKHFRLQNIIGDLIPLLETARLAGNDYSVMIMKADDYMTKLKKDFDKAGVFNQAYWTQMETMVNDEFLPRFGSYAAAQDRIEEKGLLYRMLSNKWVSATLTMAILTPIYFMSTRILALRGIDDLLMAGLFATGGYNIPKVLNPGHEPIGKLYLETCNRQNQLLHLAGLESKPVAQLADKNELMDKK